MERCINDLNKIKEERALTAALSLAKRTPTIDASHQAIQQFLNEWVDAKVCVPSSVYDSYLAL